jgi:hypothetical protein
MELRSKTEHQDLGSRTKGVRFPGSVVRGTTALILGRQGV